MNNAGTWFLKGAWIELGLEQALVEVIETACRGYRAKRQPALRVLTHTREVLVPKSETLVFMPLFEDMTRLPHLDTYTDDGLSWLTERAYVYHSETLARYLSDLTQLKLAGPLGQALARCYWQAWYATGEITDSHVFYLDMHDKVIWTKLPSPVGYVSALHEVRACLKQMFVHGRGGHALFVQTYAADMHLSEVVVANAQALEAALGHSVVQVIVTDREGLAVDVIQDLARKNKAFVTLLKANQYSSEADFTRRGRFHNLKDPRWGVVTHRVAEAEFQLKPELSLRAALIYDQSRPEKLIALVTTVKPTDEPDIGRIVQWYLARWQAQENSFRDQIAFVHLNVNFGLRAKRKVPDRRVAKQIQDQTAHLTAVTHKLASKLAQLADLERRRHRQAAQHDQTVAQLLRPARRTDNNHEQQLKAYRQKYHQRLAKLAARHLQLEHAIEAHRAAQAQTIEVLKHLDPTATFFEVDPEKDQIMAHLRVGLHNSALWARDHYFSARYQHMTPLTLWRTFFNQDGFYHETIERITITLKSFTDSRVQAEAMEACRRFNDRRIITLTGKVIELHVAVSI